MLTYRFLYYDCYKSAKNYLIIFKFIMKVNQTSNPRSYLFFSSLSYLGKTILKRIYRLPRPPFSLRMPSPITSFNVLGLDQLIFT